MRRRGLVDICADLLNAVHDGGNSTSIVFRTRMSFDRFKLYMDELAKGGLVRAQSDPQSPWTVTKRGYEYVETYRGLMELLPAHFKRGRGR